jgi:hypothetical protein
VTNVDLDPDIVSSSREDLTITVNVYDPAYFGAEQFAHGDRCWVVTLPVFCERGEHAADFMGAVVRVGHAVDGSVSDREAADYVTWPRAAIQAAICREVRKLLEAWDVELAESAAG